jgi:hypothetical protein
MDIKEWLKKHWTIISAIAALATIIIAIIAFTEWFIKVIDVIVRVIEGLPLPVIYIFVGFAIASLFLLLIRAIRRSRIRRYQKIRTKLHDLIICIVGDTSNRAISFRELREILGIADKQISYLQSALIELEDCGLLKSSRESRSYYVLQKRGRQMLSELAKIRFCESQDYERPSDKSPFISFKQSDNIL